MSSHRIFSIASSELSLTKPSSPTLGNPIQTRSTESIAVSSSSSDSGYFFSDNRRMERTVAVGTATMIFLWAHYWNTDVRWRCVVGRLCVWGHDVYHNVPRLSDVEDEEECIEYGCKPYHTSTFIWRSETMWAQIGLMHKLMTHTHIQPTIDDAISDEDVLWEKVLCVRTWCAPHCFKTQWCWGRIEK